MHSNKRRVLIFSHSLRCFTSTRLRICYQCFEFGHLAADCKNQHRCVHCAEPHQSVDCPNRENPPEKCVYCLGPHHEIKPHLQCPRLKDQKLSLVKRTEWGPSGFAG